MARQWDLERLERDLKRERSRVLRRSREAVAETATEVRDTWRSRMRARSHHGHIPYLPNAITSTVSAGDHGPEAEVGPDKSRRQGPLGNLLEFGSRNNKPHRDGYTALREREEAFVERIDQIARGAL